MTTPTPDFWKVFKETNGALSCTEAVAIMNIAADVKSNGWYIELGVAYGKSAMAAAYSLRDGTFFLVDPEFSDNDRRRQVSKSVWGINDSMVLCQVADISTNEIPKHDYYDYVFVDSGSHQDGLPMIEVRLLEDRVVQGGIIAFHDFKSQFIEVEEAYNYLLGTGKYEEIKINWQEIIDYVNENNLEKGNTSWHHNELRNPCFVGALKRK